MKYFPGEKKIIKRQSNVVVPSAASDKNVHIMDKFVIDDWLYKFEDLKKSYIPPLEYFNQICKCHKQ
jgi:hypothetical protein